jgi:hypothetical protein
MPRRQSGRRIGARGAPITARKNGDRFPAEAEIPDGRFTTVPPILLNEVGTNVYQFSFCTIEGRTIFRSV